MFHIVFILGEQPLYDRSAGSHEDLVVERADNLKPEWPWKSMIRHSNTNRYAVQVLSILGIWGEKSWQMNKWNETIKVGSGVKKTERTNKMVERLLELNLLLGAAQLLSCGSLMFSGKLGIQLQSSDLIISVSPTAIWCLAKSMINMFVSGMNGTHNPCYLKCLNSEAKQIEIMWWPLLLGHSHYLKRAEEIPTVTFVLINSSNPPI